MIIVFDVELRRPACPLLQAAFGGDTHAPMLFPVEAWLTAPTPGLARYRCTPEQLAKLIELVEKECAA